MKPQQGIHHVIPFVVMAILILPVALWLQNSWKQHREKVLQQGAWSVARNDGTLGSLSWFLSVYGNGPFADSARNAFDLRFNAALAGSPASELGQDLRTLMKSHRNVVLPVTGMAPHLSEDWQAWLRQQAGLDELILLDASPEESGFALRFLSSDDLPKQWPRLDAASADGCSGYAAFDRTWSLKGHTGVRRVLLEEGDSLVWSDSLVFNWCDLSPCDSSGLDACGLAQRSMSFDSLLFAQSGL